MERAWAQVVLFGVVPDDQQSPKKGSGTLRDVVKVESMIQLAIALPAACLIGWLVGAGLDKHFHTGWIGLAGIGVGAVAGFVQIFTTASRILNRGEGNRSDGS